MIVGSHLRRRRVCTEVAGTSCRKRFSRPSTNSCMQLPAWDSQWRHTNTHSAIYTDVDIDLDLDLDLDVGIDIDFRYQVLDVRHSTHGIRYQANMMY